MKILWGLLLLGLGWRMAAAPVASASGAANQFAAAGAVDGNRFSTANQHAWQGEAGGSNWWWQIDFEQPRQIGSILQVQGDHEFVLREAPKAYVWQAGTDGLKWVDLKETSVTAESRCYRIHRLKKSIRTRFMRLNIHATEGKAPTLREVEFYDDRAAAIPFPEWVCVVNATDDSRVPNHGKEFIPLARSVANGLEAQQIWVGNFDNEFMAVEPRPLCVLISGTFKDWCEVDRSPWRGTQEVLKSGNVPIWASCGGAQALGILQTTGVDRPWDCPHCRDPLHPKSPIYTHLGHTAGKKCGDYSGCVFERGPYEVKVLREDPVFASLPGEFTVMESHCGQLAWTPRGWDLMVTGGDRSLTKVQCIKKRHQPIYAAQFHIEMSGTPEVSKSIMAGFLAVAREWRRGAGR